MAGPTESVSPSPPEPPDHDPTRIGRYEVLAPLSMGGMAELFLGYTSGPAGFRKFVAIKKMAGENLEAGRLGLYSLA